MTRRLKHDLLESDNSAFINDYLSYRYLNEAFLNFVLKTQSLRATQSISTVANQAEYSLNADFITIYIQENGDRYIKYNNGSNNHFPREKDYGEIVHQSSTLSTAIPSGFAVIDHPSIGSMVTGSTTSAGVATNGECTLTDSGEEFSSTVNTGDVVYNDTDSSYGVVIEVTSDTALLTALFGGTNNQWASSDSYIIVPQGRMRLVIDPPPTVSGHTITVYYIPRPTPVFSPYRMFRIQSQYVSGIIREAKALYELRSGDYQKGSADKQFSDRSTLEANLSYSQTFNRKGYRVNLRRRR